MEQHYPDYPDIKKAAKYRSRQNLTKDEKNEYGQIVLKFFQDEFWPKTLTSEPPVNCASNTRHNTGKAILKAVRDQSLAVLNKTVAKEKRNRSDGYIIDQYHEHMKQQREELLK